MAEFTAVSVQTVPAQGNLLFTDEPVNNCCAIIHREGSGLVTLRGFKNQCRTRYRISFGANVAIPTDETVGPITVAISLNGEGLGSSTMIVTPTVVEAFFNINSEALVDVPAGCCATVAIKNLSTTPVYFQNSNVIVEQVKAA